MLKPTDDPLARFVALEKERREIEARLKQCKAEATAIQEQLLDDWADRGQQSAQVDGLTVYVAHDFYCRKKGGIDTKEICSVLEQHGLSRLVGPNYDASKLKSWVKEQITEGSELPSDLDDLLMYDNVPRLRTRLS